MSLLLIVAGLGLMAAGFDLSHRWSGRRADAAALMAPVGAVVAAAGAIGFMVPGFFS